MDLCEAEGPISMTHVPIDLTEKIAQLSECWSPRVVAEINDYQFKVVKLHGEFVWHDHDDTDEAFIVLKGKMEIEFRDCRVALRAGQMFVVPKGVEHLTRAADVCYALVIEPRGVVNTGATGGPKTAPKDLWL